jgi:hypothetical protein
METASRTHVSALALAVILAGGCGSASEEDPPMAPDSSGLEADPFFYKLDSVTGAVLANDKGIAGATITVVSTGETMTVEDSGAYVLVLDPEKLGGRKHELLFSAPGYKDQTHTVEVPEKNQIRLDVELEPEG